MGWEMGGMNPVKALFQYLISDIGCLFIHFSLYINVYIYRERERRREKERERFHKATTQYILFCLRSGMYSMSSMYKSYAMCSMYCTVCTVMSVCTDRVSAVCTAKCTKYTPHIVGCRQFVTQPITFQKRHVGQQKTPAASLISRTVLGGKIVHMNSYLLVYPTGITNVFLY